MRLFKYAVIAAVVVGGWWTGQAMKDRKVEVKPAADPSGAAVVAAYPNEPVAPPVDPSLILPPPPETGAMIDMPIGDIRAHFRDKAGLTKGDVKQAVSESTNQPFKDEAIAPSGKVEASPLIVLSLFGPTPAELGSEISVVLQATYKGGKSAIEITLHTELSLGLEHPEGFDIEAVVKLKPDVPQSFSLRLRATDIGRQTVTVSARSCPNATAVLNLDVQKPKKPTKGLETNPGSSAELANNPKPLIAIAYAEAKLGPAPSEINPAEPKANLQDAPPSPEPVKLPPTIRLPAPPEEPPPSPTPSPTVKRVLHRQIAMWMYVNQRDLRLNFDVTRQGSSGIKSVELWARRSSEQDYECVDRMDGDKTPFATRLWSEGNYELRLVFVSGSGVKSPAPSRNDLPDVYVCLDTTPPVVELLPPSADEPGVTKLRWKAFDTNLEEQAIRLQYSVDGETWHPVGEGEANEWLPNTGEYAWKVPAGLPHEMHLRVQARDKAGNIGEAHSHGKFSVDLVVPEGRISGMVEQAPEPRAFRGPGKLRRAGFHLARKQAYALEDDNGRVICYLTSVLESILQEQVNKRVVVIGVVLVRPDIGGGEYMQVSRVVAEKSSELSREPREIGLSLQLWPFPESVPDYFPLPKELGYQEETAGLLGPVTEVLPAPRIVRRRTIPVHDGSIPVRDPTPELLPEPREFRVNIQTEEQERPALNPEFDQSRELLPMPAGDSAARKEALVEPAGREIAEVVVQGNRLRTAREIQSKMNTRPGQRYREIAALLDVAELLGTGWFTSSGAMLSTEIRPDGRITVTVQVTELPNTIQRVTYRGADHFSCSELGKLTGLKRCSPMSPPINQAARQSVIRAYQERGRYWTTVKIIKGADLQDSEVVFDIVEGPIVKISGIEFKFSGESKTDASNGRLRRQIQSSKALLELIGEDFNPALIEEQITKIADHYHNLGYLDARVQRELLWADDQRTVKIVFHIEEGQRYRVKNLRIGGNWSCDEAELRSYTHLLSTGDSYDKSAVRNDLLRLRDYYLIRGQVVVVRERLQQSGSGEVDVVYQIKEPEPMGWFLEEFLPKKIHLPVTSKWEPRFTLPPPKRLPDQTEGDPNYLSECHKSFLEAIRPART